MNTIPAVGLALSGGGSRAIAFGLGCLRALHDCDVLRHVRVVSGISGGSVLAAMWAYGPATFSEFDEAVTDMLRRGLQLDLARRALSPRSLVRGAAGVIRAAPLMPGRRPRAFTRTELLAQVLRSRLFSSLDLSEVVQPELATVISATDLTTTNAVRFGSGVSSCSAFGRITDRIPVADAVAASAAFPVLLPALVRRYEFQTGDGRRAHQVLTMTDGGVYDNLALLPLMPGRSAAHTSHVYELDHLIAVDSGRGRSLKGGAVYFPTRMARSLDITFAKAQDATRSQLHKAAESRQLRGFVHSYLAMHDRNLPVPLADLVPRSAVIGYPTNFSAMSATDLTLLTTRGEQLTRVLLAHYCPQLTH
ncbi:patatin-like phospholipase family protein [Actinosynnema sp. CA-248983]